LVQQVPEGMCSREDGLQQQLYSFVHPFIKIRIAPLKCLSLKQPYAELLISGKKTIELRNWTTKFRGKFLIHASKKVDKERSESLGINHQNLIRGALIGTANLYDIKQYMSKAELEKDKSKNTICSWVQ
jgi:hypothetical protein